jgi:enoyl-CoA hydratase/carnithine racemase
VAGVATEAGLRALTLSDANGAARVTLDRPDKRNALSLELMDELTQVLQTLGPRSDLRAIVVQGSGAAFSAGHDLSEMVGRGLFCSTPMVPLSRAIGRKRALEMLLTGEPISALTALEWGLVNRVVPATELDAAVDELVAAISRSSPLTVGIGKEAFYEQVELDEHRAYDLTKAVMAMNARADDAQEGMCAFLEKRAPEWRGT